MTMQTNHTIKTRKALKPGDVVLDGANVPFFRVKWNAESQARGYRVICGELLREHVVDGVRKNVGDEIRCAGYGGWPVGVLVEGGAK
jgi:hypothetical protein